LLDRLLAAGSYVEIATHDDRLVTRSLGVADGHRIRVYVPYGASWHAYALRRLRENPQVGSYVLRDTLRALRPTRRRP
jgi:proline dehydrogenase